MNKKQFRVNDLVKFNYSEVGEYVDENHTDRPLRNDEVCDLLNEQQATIRQLQDLCGESDGENAKLRIENKMLEKEVNLLRPTNLEQYEQIQKLQKENEQLKNELRKEKSLQEYSDSMYGADLIVDIRFSNGKWKADVSVIEDE